MERTYKTIAGLTYADLDAALRQLGYVRETQETRVSYRHPGNEKARVLLPLASANEEVRGIDLVTTRAIVDGFGIMDAKNFEFLLVRLTGSKDLALR